MSLWGCFVSKHAHDRPWVMIIIRKIMIMSQRWRKGKGSGSSTRCLILRCFFWVLFCLGWVLCLLNWVLFSFSDLCLSWILVSLRLLFIFLWVLAAYDCRRINALIAPVPAWSLMRRVLLMFIIYFQRS